MSLHRLTLHLVAVACLTVASCAAAVAQTVRPPIVVELFTSQGCSSCPAADRLLQDLSERAGLLALSLAITYWDHLGWKDTLAHPTNTERQRLYATALGLQNVYTPQMVVAGTRSLVGSHRSEAEAAIAAAREDAPPAPALGAQIDGTALTIDIGETRSLTSRERTAATVWVMPYRTRVEVPVSKGENRGRKLVYANAVAAVTEAGRWDGLPVSLSVPLASLALVNCDAVAVLLQSGRVGPILAATTLALP